MILSLGSLLSKGSVYLTLRLISSLNLLSSGLTLSACTAVIGLGAMIPRLIDSSKDVESNIAVRGSPAVPMARTVLPGPVNNRNTNSFLASTKPPSFSRVHFDPVLKGREFSTAATLVDDPLMDKLGIMKEKFWAKGLTWVDPHPGLGRGGFQ